MTSHKRSPFRISRKCIQRYSLAATLLALGCAGTESLTDNTGAGEGTGAGEAASGGAGTAAGGAIGLAGSGGALSTGGAAVATGGASSGGAAMETGGAHSGGMSASGGANSGGMPGAGGGMGSGGASEPCVVPTEEVCGMGSNTSVHCGLTYELWADAGSACMTNTADGFLAEWSGNNYIARVGLRPEESEMLVPPVVTYSATYNTNGTSYLTVYGWTTDPLVEFYILEAHDPAYRPPGNGADVTSFPDIQVDGGTYEVRRSQRNNQPSIIGTTSFPQYWSLRTQNRTSGSINVAEHFAAWEQAGLEMGDIYEVSMAVEGFGSSGTAEVQVSFE